eukprot:1095418-Amphidinium_carterae.1
MHSTVIWDRISAHPNENIETSPKCLKEWSAQRDARHQFGKPTQYMKMFKGQQQFNNWHGPFKAAKDLEIAFK